MDVTAFLGAMTVFFLIVCPVIALAIWYDFRHDAPWSPALKWSLLLFVLIAFSGSMVRAQMVSDINWCSQVSGFWYYAGGCFLPGM